MTQKLFHHDQHFSCQDLCKNNKGNVKLQISKFPEETEEDVPVYSYILFLCLCYTLKATPTLKCDLRHRLLCNFFLLWDIFLPDAFIHINFFSLLRCLNLNGTKHFYLWLIFHQFKRLLKMHKVDAFLIIQLIVFPIQLTEILYRMDLSLRENEVF